MGPHTENQEPSNCRKRRRDSVSSSDSDSDSLTETKRAKIDPIVTVLDSDEEAEVELANMTHEEVMKNYRLNHIETVSISSDDDDDDAVFVFDKK